MAYTFVPCPPLAPTETTPPTWTAPDDSYAVPGSAGDERVCEIATTPTVYYSAEVLVYDVCSDGPQNLITFIVPAFSFSSTVSQIDADYQATAYSLERLAELRGELPCEGTFNLLELSGGDLFSLSNGQNLLLLI